MELNYTRRIDGSVFYVDDRNRYDIWINEQRAKFYCRKGKYGTLFKRWRTWLGM